MHSGPAAIQRWKLTTALRAVLAFACGFAVWQPFAYWLFHLLLRRPHAIVTKSQWLTFELSVTAVGAIAGACWYYSRRSIPRTRAQYWGDSGIGCLSICSMIAADDLAALPWIQWILVVVLSAALCGVLFGSASLFVAKSINSSRTI